MEQCVGQHKFEQAVAAARRSPEEIAEANARLDARWARMMAPGGFCDRIFAQHEAIAAEKKRQQDAIETERRERREAIAEEKRVERAAWNEQRQSLNAVSNWDEMAAHCQEYQPGAIRCCFSPAILMTQWELRLPGRTMKFWGEDAYMEQRERQFTLCAYRHPTWNFAQVENALNARYSRRDETGYAGYCDEWEWLDSSALTFSAYQEYLDPPHLEF